MENFHEGGISFVFKLFANSELVNYKNLSSTRFSFTEGVNTVIGENDSGKSNAMTALRILLDDTYYYNTKRLKENDFSDLLSNWKGHWIILSAVLGKITSEDKETEVCAGIVPEKENEDFLKSYIKSGADNIGVISLFIRPQKQVRKKLSEITDIVEFEKERNKIRLSEKIDPYKVLKIINSITPIDENGIVYLQEAITRFLIGIGIDLSIEAYLNKAYEDFMARVKDRVKNNHLSTDVDVFKQCFEEKEGVVINTFHGVKGEEYTTVIAFGILNGYIPHWDIIINKPLYREDETKKLLYVVCSRAKKNLYLFSEQGRTTQRGAPLLSTDEILAIDYEYDSLF